MPEEINRSIVDNISDVTMAYFEQVRSYMADIGLPKERTYVTGSFLAEVLHGNLAETETSINIRDSRRVGISLFRSSFYGNLHVDRATGGIR